MSIKDLNGEQRRQFIDTQQAYEAWRAAHQASQHRYAGSMRWVDRGNTQYLLRKIGKVETSLGLRSPETETAYKAFVNGREKNKERLDGLTKQLDDLAPINRAMGIGRMPTIAARILRRCEDFGLLGEQLIVVGTNALFAYESLAGVQAQSGILTTSDIDLLFDARRHISLALNTFRTSGLIGLLQKVDESFAPIRPRGFRAANKDGYLVDLIRPQAKDVYRDRLPASLSDLPDDLEGAPIFGLAWLINSPRVDAVAIDERGYPVRVVAIDPRAFALHKLWLSSRPDREPIKAARDREQAEVAAVIATRYLRSFFDSPDLAALPKDLRKLAPKLIGLDTKSEKPKSEGPDW